MPGLKKRCVLQVSAVKVHATTKKMASIKLVSAVQVTVVLGRIEVLRVTCDNTGRIHPVLMYTMASHRAGALVPDPSCVHRGTLN